MLTISTSSFCVELREESIREKAYLDRGSNEIFISACVYKGIASFFKFETRSLCSRMWSSEEWPLDPFIIFLLKRRNRRRSGKSLNESSRVRYNRLRRCRRYETLLVRLPAVQPDSSNKLNTHCEYPWQMHFLSKSSYINTISSGSRLSGNIYISK